MSQYETMILEKKEGVAILTFNRPEKLNAINPQWAADFFEAMKEISNDDSVRAIIFTGAGRAFCAGLDLDYAQELAEAQKRGEDAYKGLSGSSAAMIKIVRELPKVTIGAINGPASGGGITIALGCDIRIAAKDALIIFPFVPFVGLTPEVGSTYTLPRLIGSGRAFEILCTGKPISGKEAAEIGLVNYAVPNDKLMEKAMNLAQSFAKAAPIALQLAKQLIYEGLDADFYHHIAREDRALISTFRTEDHAEGVRAFLEKRKPVFKGK